MPKRYKPIVYIRNYEPMPFQRQGPKKTDEATGIPTYVGRQVVDDFGMPSDYLMGSLDRWKGDSNAPVLNDSEDNGLASWPRVNCSSRFRILPNGDQQYY